MKADAELTPRETEVAELLAWGAAKKEVADRYYISVRTVENTARNIYEKVDIQKSDRIKRYGGFAPIAAYRSTSPL